MAELLNYEEVETDVLVIGGGAAATEAAISVADAGKNVVLIDKKKYGRSGDSGVHPAGIHSASYLKVEGDDVNTNLGDAVKAGKWMINQKLAEALCKAVNQNKIFHKVENYGSLETRTDDGKLALIYSENKRRATSGYRLFTHAYEVFKRNIRVIDHTMMTSLLTKGDEVIGATAINIRTGKFHIFRAKSTILATGGVGLAINGALVNERTGDGHAAAYKIGAEFWNMEFRSMALGCIYPTCLSRVPYVMQSLRTVRDKNGVEFMKNLPEVSDESGTRFFRAIKEVEKRIACGKGSPHGGVYGLVLPRIIIPAVNLLLRQGFDINLFEHYWTTVYDYGGLVIDSKSQTTVPGLYACGEIAANMGAGYHPIRMFSHCITTGRWAGENAARRSKRVRKKKLYRNQVLEEYKRVYGILERCPRNPIAVHQARQEIQQTAIKGCGPCRSEKKAIEALEDFEQINREVLPRMYVRDKARVCNMEWKEALEAFNMIICGEMVTRAALARTESRGVHIREDYPFMDNDNWLKNIYIKQAGNGMKLSIKPIVISQVEPPCGKIWLE